MKLIRTNEEFVKALSIPSISADFELIESQQLAVIENYIQRVTGEALLETLKAKIDDVEVLDDLWQGLLDNIQRPVAMLSYLRSVALFDVNARPGGFTVSVDDNSVPASKNRVKQFKQALWHQAQESLNALVKFLDKNRDSFDDYRDSEAEKRRFSNLVNTFDDWTHSVQHQAGDWVIDRLRPNFTEIEETVREVICSDLFDFFQTRIQDRSQEFLNNGVDYAPLLPVIRRYICNATMAMLVEQNNILVSGSRAYVVYEEGDDSDFHTRPADVVNRDSYRIIYKNSAGTALKTLRRMLKDGNYPLWANSPCAEVQETLKPNSTNGIFPAFGVNR